MTVLRRLSNILKMGIKGRALHYVFKVPNRKETGKFFLDLLGMKVLRHEEFSDGCEAACNGPYANRWSKTMVGYGPEDSHFVMELTYNYTKTSYQLGNEFLGITIKSSEALKRAKEMGWPVGENNLIKAPGGYKFYLIDEPQPTNKDPVVQVSLACSNLTKSISYWNGLLGLTILDRTAKSVTLAYKADETHLHLQEIDEPINRAEAYGRIAFSVPHNEQDTIDKVIKEHNQNILTPLISLDTPGKATVRVIILADPDGHEICFVDDEAFRQLSEVDPEGDKLFKRYTDKDQ